MKDFNIHLDPKDARVTFVTALAWRAATELVRRHHPLVDFSLRQVHPGISVRGVLVLEAKKKSDRTTATIDFNLGGPSGSWHGLREAKETSGSLTPLLEAEPKRVVDAMQDALGFQTPCGPTANSTPQVVALRTLTGLIEQQVFDPTPWRISLGALGWSENLVCDWADVFMPGVSKSKRIDEKTLHQLSTLALLHAAPNEEPLLQRSQLKKRKALAVRLSDGAVFVIDAKTKTPIPELPMLYEQKARKIKPVLRLLSEALDL